MGGRGERAGGPGTLCISNKALGRLRQLDHAAGRKALASHDGLHRVPLKSSPDFQWIKML